MLIQPNFQLNTLPFIIQRNPIMWSKMSLTNLLSVWRCVKGPRLFASFAAEKTSAVLIGMIFWKYSKFQRVMVLLLHKGTGTSFTSEKHKQLTFISVWIMNGTVLYPLVRWDFFGGFRTTNWACFAWFSQAMKGHYSSFPFWFKYKIKTLIPPLSSLWNPSLIAAWTNRFTPV